MSSLHLMTGLCSVGRLNESEAIVLSDRGEWMTSVTHAYSSGNVNLAVGQFHPVGWWGIVSRLHRVVGVWEHLDVALSNCETPFASVDGSGVYHRTWCRKCPDSCGKFGLLDACVDLWLNLADSTIAGLVDYWLYRVGAWGDTAFRCSRRQDRAADFPDSTPERNSHA